MPKLIAHRGYKKSAKENTLLSFYAALNGNFAGFELDLRQSADGKYVVYHDATYEGKLVSNTKYHILKKGGVPLLEEVLRINTQKIILIDLKNPHLDIEGLINILRKYEQRNIYLMSFYEKPIKKLDILSRKYKIGVLNYVLNTDDSHFNYDFIAVLESVANPKLILDFKNRKKEVFIYGMLTKNYKYDYPYYIVD